MTAGFLCVSVSLWLLMEAGNKHGFADNMAVHSVNDLVAKIDDCLSRRAGGRLRDIELRVERIQFERVVVIRSCRRPWPHVAETSQAYLTCTVRQLTLCNTFRKPRRCSRDVPDQPMRDVHLCSAALERLRVVQQ